MREGKLFVLGAGASIGAKRYPKDLWGQKKKLPSGNDFFKDLFELDKKSEQGLDFMNFLDMMDEGTNQMIVQGWRLDSETQFFDPSEWENINIEEVFTFFDIGENMYEEDSGYYRSFKAAKETLKETIFHQIFFRTRGQRCLLLEELFKNLSPDDDIISFNWDTLAEATLEHLDKVHFENYKKLFQTPINSIEDFTTSGGVLLKLHGSINWSVCKNENCEKFDEIQFLPLEKDKKITNTSFEVIEQCKYCGKRLNPYIIPPTSNKINIHKETFINKIWLIARDILRYVEEIIFIGYSFPPTDYYSQWLFRQINYLYNEEDESFPTTKITIVNPEMADKSSDTYKRYKRLFNGHEIKTFKTLETYVNR